MKKKSLHYDIIVGAVLIVISAALFPQTFKFPGTAGIFPQFILVVLAILGIYTLIYGIKETKDTAAKAAAGEEVAPVFSWAKDKLPLLGYALIVVYILLIKPLGFFLSTTLFLVGYMWFLKIRKPLTLALVTVFTDVFLYVLFVILLKLNLPSGILM